jgi:hypothetical protein
MDKLSELKAAAKAAKDAFFNSGDYRLEKAWKKAADAAIRAEIDELSRRNSDPLAGFERKHSSESKASEYHDKRMWFADIKY